MSLNNAVFVGMCGGFGPLAQALPIALELRKRGMDIICHNYRAAADMVKKMGLKFYELPPLGKPEKINPNGAEWWNEDYEWSKYGYLDYDYVKRLVEAFTRGIDQYKPKAVISVHLPSVTVAAKKLGIPVVSVVQACMHRYGRGGRTTWWKELPENLDRTSPVLNRIFHEWGMPLIEKMEDLNEGDLTIIPSIPELDPIDNGNVFYTGPMFWQGPEEEYRDAGYKIQKKNQYLVFAYTGHLFSSTGRETGILLLKNIVTAFNNTEFDIIVATGTGQKIPEELEVAENITITEWAPVNLIIPQCDLIIHHGGHGSSLQGLAHGIPSIILPLTDEREYNARQVAELDMGLFLTPEEISPDVLLAKARQIVGNAEIGKKGRALCRTIKNRNYDGAVKAADMILELINR